MLRRTNFANGTISGQSRTSAINHISSLNISSFATLSIHKRYPKYIYIKSSLFSVITFQNITISLVLSLVISLLWFNFTFSFQSFSVFLSCFSCCFSCCFFFVCFPAPLLAFVRKWKEEFTTIGKRKLCEKQKYSPILTSISTKSICKIYFYCWFAQFISANLLFFFI